MKIEVLESDEKSIQLLIQGVDIPFINALRRAILTEVPCMAIDEVLMLENSSLLPDEMIAHRLGFIPLTTDLDGYNLPEKCSCKSEFGCSLCRVTLTLDTDALTGTTTIYSGELKSDNPSIVPVSAKIPLIKLSKEQKIRFESYAKLGRGKEHAKWQPVSVSAYKYFPQIEIDATRCDGCGKCVEICPRYVLTKSDKKLVVRDLTACTLCQDCVNICPQNPPAIDVSWEENKFIFNLISTGVLTPERILLEAAKIVNEKFCDFESKIQVFISEKNSN